MADRDRWEDDRERRRARGDDDRDHARRGGGGGDGAGSSGYGPGGRTGRDASGYLGGDDDDVDLPRHGGGGGRDDDRDRGSYGREEYGRDGYEAQRYGGGGGRESFGRDYGRYGSGGGDRQYGPGPRPERDPERERERARGIPEAGEGAYGRGFVGNQGRGFGYGPDQRSPEFGRAGGGNATSSGQDGGDRSWWERATDEVASWFGDEPAEQRRQADHRGRGPRGYTRSDERIKEDVSDRLSDDRHVDASEIDVEVSGGEVTLAGTVDSREARRRAEDVADGVSGVTHVQNNLRVRQPGGGGSSAGAGGMIATDPGGSGQGQRGSGI